MESRILFNRKMGLGYRKNHLLSLTTSNGGSLNAHTKKISKNSLYKDICDNEKKVCRDATVNCFML